MHKHKTDPPGLSSAAHDIGLLRRLNSLLDEALHQPVAQREQWLRTLAPEHVDLQPMLRQMLANASVEADDFLSEPVQLEQMVPAALITADAPLQRVGPYQLLRELGTGGMGTVWLAHRIDGSMSRQVALKLPRFAWVSNLSERMQRERDILAALEHPNIARLYDAGVTEEGRPYLALEYVEGQAIDAYCTAHQLGIPARLALFLQVTNAVSHAHARLIVHRDLKPSNVLVSEDAQVHLLDFGVAKLLDESILVADDKTVKLTQYAGQAFTPDYASPEQLRGELITVASDVYSLGVLLFELLTGKLPHARPKGSIAEILEALATETVVLPSHTGDSRDTRTLKGDLDTIISKALKKETSERYPSVEALSADIARYLAGEPVLAQPDSALYRFRKYLKRNLIAVLSGVAVLISLGMGSGIALWQAQVARAEAKHAEQVKRFIASIFTNARPREGVGGVVSATELLKAASTRMQNELNLQPKVAAELTVIISESFDALAEPQLAEPLLRYMLPKAVETLGDEDLTTAQLKILLADVGSPLTIEADVRLLDEAINTAMKYLPAASEELANALKLKSFKLAKLNQAEPSINALKQAIVIAEEQLGKDHPRTILFLGFLSNTYGRFGEHSQQLSVATEAHERATRVLSSQRPNNILSNVERWYGEALRRNERPADAIPILRRVLADQEQLDGSITLRSRNAKVQLSIALQSFGELTEALKLMREAVALEMKQNATEGDDRRSFADAIAELLSIARHVDEGLAENTRASEVSARVGNNSARSTIARLLRQARLLAMNAEFDEAHVHISRALLLAKDEKTPSPAAALLTQAYILQLQGNSVGALEVLEQLGSSDHIEALPFKLQSDIAAIQGLALLTQGDMKAAAEQFKTCELKFKLAQINPSAMVTECLTGAARLALANADPMQAIQILAPLERSWANVNHGSPWHGEALYWLAQAQSAAGDKAQAKDNLRMAQSWLRQSKLPALRKLAASP